MAQRFVYLAGGQEVVLEDPDGVYMPEQVKQHWATTFPELSNATWDTKAGADGVKVVTFAKKVGVKGANAPAFKTTETTERQVIVKVETLEGELLSRFDTFADHCNEPFARFLEDLEEAIWEAMFRDDKHLIPRRFLRVKL